MVSSVCAIVGVALICTMIVKPLGSTPVVCTTKDCALMSSAFQVLMDRSVDPCEDFYNFTCGNIYKYSKDPPEVILSSPFKNIQHDFQMHTLELFTSLLRNSYRERLLLQQFKSCLNTDEIQRLDLEPLKGVLQKLGGFPVLSGAQGWDQNPSAAKTFNWVDMMIRLSRMGINHNLLFTIDVGADPRNSSKTMIQITKPSFTMAERMFKIFGYKWTLKVAFIARMFSNLNEIGTKWNSLMSLYGAVNLGTELLQNLDVTEQISFPKLMKLRDLKMIAPNTEWERLITEVSGIDVDGDFELLVNHEYYITYADSVLAKANKKDLANLILIKIVPRIWNFDEVFPKDETDRIIKHVQCGLETSSSLAFAFAHEFYKNFVSPHDKSAIEGMVEMLKSELMDDMKQADWLRNEHTKDLAMEKIRAMSAQIGNHEVLSNGSLIDQLYKGLSLDKKSYFDNKLKIEKWNKELKFSLLSSDRLIDQGSFNYAFMINAPAYYSPQTNELTINPIMMQYMFFSTSRPTYMNFAAMGAVLGHEITHSLDPNGRNYDKNGNKVDWWDSETKVSYDEKADCFRKQFDGLLVPRTPNSRVDGNLTLGENIADAGGFVLAYRSYLRWLDEHKPEPLLSGLTQLNQRQMFWLTTALTWCDNKSLAELEILAEIDPHSPHSLRVNQAFANFESFAKDFKCPVGSKMNPRNKCKLW